MTREERGDMSVLAHTKQHDVEHQVIAKVVAKERIVANRCGRRVDTPIGHHMNVRFRGNR